MHSDEFRACIIVYNLIFVIITTFIYPSLLFFSILAEKTVLPEALFEFRTERSFFLLFCDQEKY